MADRYHASTCPLLPGAVEAVRRLAQRWPLGLASSSPRRLIDSSRRRTSLRVTMSTEQVAEGKPSPRVYLAVATDLEVTPDAVVAIEDRRAAARSASGAGMHVIAVPHPAFPPAPDALSLAEVVVEHLDDVTVDLVESPVPGS